MRREMRLEERARGLAVHTVAKAKRGFADRLGLRPLPAGCEQCGKCGGVIVLVPALDLGKGHRPEPDRLFFHFAPPNMSAIATTIAASGNSEFVIRFC